MQPYRRDRRTVPPAELGPALAALREIILHQWCRRVNAEIPAARRLGTPILYDTFPLLFANMVEALSGDPARPNATAGTSLAHAHGRERAIVTGYGAHDLLHELQVFREVLFAVLRGQRLALDRRSAETIGHSIEQAMREAISGFSAAGHDENQAFVSSLSHDLRNPLHVASATAQLIELKTTDPGIAGLARRIGTKIGEADAMIQTLLDAAVRGGRMKLRLDVVEFDIMGLVEEVCADLPLLGQPVRPVGERLVGHWCRTSLKRVLENLVNNARKYGDRRTPVTVRVGHSQGRMLLSVHNDGTPIPADRLARLFDGDQHIERVDIRGWGLGLPFVQRVAESHGGSVIADSGAGRGTTFTVSLPLDARPYAGQPDGEPGSGPEDRQDG